MFDTHCHLNFKAFKKTLPEVITKAHSVGVSYIVIPGTDVKTSKKAVEIASQNENMYAAVGIHPHHVFKLMKNHQLAVKTELEEIEKLVNEPGVVAIGEIGMDRHAYEETVYKEYQVDAQFLELQKELLEKQIQLAVKHKKSLILHNREAKADLLPIVERNWHNSFQNRSVFHCCEPDEELLSFATDHKMYIGVDGDLTYSPEKKEFIKIVPLTMLVLETDSPFLLPEPLKSERKFPNEPKNIRITAETVAEVKKITVEEVIAITTQNAQRLFNLN
jgi:TatD DNase family protein